MPACYHDPISFSLTGSQSYPGVLLFEQEPEDVKAYTLEICDYQYTLEHEGGMTNLKKASQMNVPLFHREKVFTDYHILLTYTTTPLDEQPFGLW